MVNKINTRVVIVRHGLSTYNSQQRIQGRCDESTLTDQGIEQANILGQTISKANFAAIYCSPLQRAKLTAEIIQSKLVKPLPLSISDLLMEIDLPLWEGLQKAEVKQKYPEEYKKWKAQPDKFSMTITKDEESVEHFPVLALGKQAIEFWQEVLAKHQGETILVVAHNGINRALLTTALGMNPSRYQHIQQSNCAVNVLNFTDGWGGAVQLESLNQTAHLGQVAPTPREGQRGLRLLLVRHGETQWNRETRFQGQIDVPLNDNGRLQSQKAASLLENVTIDFAITSPMLRPKETAEIILYKHPQVNLQLEPQLKEINHGLWEGKLEAEIEEGYAAELETWRSHPELVQMPEGENLQDVWSRAIAVWNKIVTQVEIRDDRLTTGLVVAHDAINKVILCYLMGLTPADFWKIKQGNGAVSIIDYPRGQEGICVLQSVNITSHLSGSIFDQTAAGAL